MKIVIYQILMRLFGGYDSDLVNNGSLQQNKCGKVSELSTTVLKEIKDLGVSHLWLTGMIRHASSTAYPEIGIEASHPAILKGAAGSPYAIKDYFDLCPDLFEEPEQRFNEFDKLISRCLKSKLSVIIDFVPNHVSRDYLSKNKPTGVTDLGANDDSSKAFEPNNNFYYLPNQELKLVGPNQSEYTEYPAKVSGNDVFHNHPAPHDWYETIKLNYGLNPQEQKLYVDPIPDTWEKMLEILDFWAQKGVGGFRCDMAAMVPPQFWSYAIKRIKEKYPHIIFIAEIYEPHLYTTFLDAGFDYLYDKVGLYDATRSIIEHGGSTNLITRVWQELKGHDKSMLRFMENHDEHRLASKEFKASPEQGLAATALAAFMNQGPLLIYFGQELGESASGSSGFSGDDGRTTLFDYWIIPTINQWLKHINKQPTDPSKPLNFQLRKAYQKILLTARSHPVFANGGFYDLMWINQDRMKEQNNSCYGFLRHYKQDIYLIVIRFDERIKKTSIRLNPHALETTGLGITERYKVKSLHPFAAHKTLLQSQIISSGIDITFDYSGWAITKISAGS